MRYLILSFILIFTLSNCSKSGFTNRDIKALDGQWVAYQLTDSNGLSFQTDNLGIMNIFGVYNGGMLITNKGCDCQATSWTSNDYGDMVAKPAVGKLKADVSTQTFTITGLEFPLNYKIVKFSATDIWLNNGGFIVKIKKLG
jgi:hypothetical protein